MRIGALGAGIVVASIGAGVGALSLLQYLYHQRDRPGAIWFVGNIAAVAAFCLAYGTGLLVFDPTLRAGDETKLQHGQGIGLWLVYWCVRKLDGSIAFEYDDGNVLTVTLPRASRDAPRPDP